MDSYRLFSAISAQWFCFIFYTKAWSFHWYYRCLKTEISRDYAFSSWLKAEQENFFKIKLYPIKEDIYRGNSWAGLSNSEYITDVALWQNGYF